MRQSRIDEIINQHRQRVAMDEEWRERRQARQEHDARVLEEIREMRRKGSRAGRLLGLAIGHIAKSVR